MFLEPKYTHNISKAGTVERWSWEYLNPSGAIKGANDILDFLRCSPSGLLLNYFEEGFITLNVIQNLLVLTNITSTKLYFAGYQDGSPVMSLENPREGVKRNYEIGFVENCEDSSL